MVCVAHPQRTSWCPSLSFSRKKKSFFLRHVCGMQDHIGAYLSCKRIEYVGLYTRLGFQRRSHKFGYLSLCVHIHVLGWYPAQAHLLCLASALHLDLKPLLQLRDLLLQHLCMCSMSPIHHVCWLHVCCCTCLLRTPETHVCKNMCGHQFCASGITSHKLWQRLPFHVSACIIQQHPDA